MVKVAMILGIAGLIYSIGLDKELRRTGPSHREKDAILSGPLSGGLR